MYSIDFVMEKVKIVIPQNCIKIIERLNKNGFEGYIVGGCVRDFLLGKAPNDWDITTDAMPDKIKQTFNADADYLVIPTGEPYGTITLHHRETKENFEVTTYRLDGDYADGRRPSAVTFSDYIYDDLSRRDFTINAMAYNAQKGLVDAHGGKKDLQNKTLRLVGNPSERLREDGLRIMRGIRFAYKLRFSLNYDSLSAMSDGIKQGYLKRISSERIKAELEQILEYFYIDNDTFSIFEEMLFDVIPELSDTRNLQQNNPYHSFDVWMHTVIALANTPVGDHAVRMTVLLHDIGKAKTKTTDEKGVDHFYNHQAASVEIARAILKRLKYDNKTKNDILLLIEYHDEKFMSNKAAIKRMLNKLGTDNFKRLLAVRYADTVAHNPSCISGRLEKLDTEKELFLEIIAGNECYTIKDLDIDGNDLIKIGIEKSKIGGVLDRCLEAVITEACQNEKEKLVKFVKTFRRIYNEI